jgi:isopentenyl-diphosphate delta-isomerase
MGFDCGIQHRFSFIYRAELDQGMTEHELDHVFTGNYNHDPGINPEEVHDWKWIDIPELVKDMEANPEVYTVWFRIIFKEFRKQLDF